MKKNIEILLVEDDPNFGAVLRDYLSLHEYHVTLCTNGLEGSKALEHNTFDLCIFDVMMPQKDGFTLAAEMRNSNKHTPFIFLTAKGLKEDVIKGFKLGADDYINKPFDSEVLLLKIKAILQRYKAPALVSVTYQIAGFTFDVKRRNIQRGDTQYKLSPKEAALLQLLCEHINTVLPRTTALNEIWKDDSYFTARSMDVYIAKLRKYFQEDSSISIDNVHGSGFSLTTNNSINSTP